MIDSPEVRSSASEREERERARLAWLAYFRHELRTPINAIIGYSEMSLEELAERADAPFTEDLEHVRIAGQQLLAAVNRFLDPEAIAATVKAGGQPLSNAELHHELRIPLNAIVGYSEMLIEDAADRNETAFLSDLGRIHTSGIKLAELIDSLRGLSYSEPESVAQSGDGSAADLMSQAVAATSLKPAAALTRIAPALVLVVDDLEVNRDILTRRLEQEGHTVVQAESGPAALELMNAHAFDLVMLDIMMPGMTGYEVLEKMQTRSDWGEVPVIVISALYEMDSVVKCIELGAEDYLPKPFNAVLLKARTSASIEKKRLRAARLEQERKEAERMRREIAVAARVQRQLLPQSLPQIHGLELAGSCTPALEVGGDYFDFLELPGDALGIAVADVAGKGMPAALLMSSMLAGLRSGAPLAGGHLDEMVSSLNELVHGLTEGLSFITFFYAQFDRKSGLLRYVNAGHNPPLLVRSDPQTAPEELSEGGPVLGFLPGLTYTQAVVQMNPGDTLVGFTDGVTEAFNKDTEQFGDERLLEALASSPGASATTVQETIVNRVAEWRGSAPQSDDLTIVVMRIKPEARP